MSKGSVNKVILVGNLGNDPEMKYMPGGGAVTNISIATSESWKDKQTGQPQERTEWHRVVFFNKLGEIAGQYLKKGSKVYVEGALRTRKWQGQDGQDRYTTEIVANEMQMLGGRGDDFQPPQPPMGGQPPQRPMGGQPPQRPMGGQPPQPPMGGQPPQSPMGGQPPQSPMGGQPPQPPQPPMGGQPHGFDNYDDDIPF